MARGARLERVDCDGGEGGVDCWHCGSWCCGGAVVGLHCSHATGTTMALHVVHGLCKGTELSGEPTSR